MHTTSRAPSSYWVTRLESVHHHHGNNRGKKTMYLSPSAQSVSPTHSYRELLQNIKYRLCLLLNTHLQPSHIHTYTHTHQTRHLATNHQWQMLHRTLSSRQTAGGHRGQTFAPQSPSRPSPQKSYRHYLSYCNCRNQLHIIHFHTVYELNKEWIWGPSSYNQLTARIVTNLKEVNKA